jgi:hypothetical protein
VPAPGSKPLDAGTGRVAASFDPRSAAWQSIGTPHPRHGFVELSAVPPFAEAGRGDPAATRAHRLALTQPDHAFLVIEIDGRRPVLEPSDDSPIPAWSAAGVAVSTLAEPDAPWLGQRWRIEGGQRGQPRVEIRLSGRLDRPALAEITETDPPRSTRARSSWRTHGAQAIVQAGSLPARAVVTVEGAAVEWVASGDSRFAGRVEWPEGTDWLQFDVRVELDSGSPMDADPAPLPEPGGDRLTRRALAYVRGCTALRTGRGERVILTDHRILPLSWTRDAYWQALALLAADAPGDRDRVADHLRWLWRRCDRPDGWWARSHHADGRRKDLAFQADQQLYPLLELADFHERTAALPSGVAWAPAVAAAWAASEDRVDPRSGLLASGENAADDPAGLPFIGASQILRWLTATRLERLARDGVLDLDPVTFATAADMARAAFAAHFERGSEPWPYAVDAAGGLQAYHDANDLPVALAPAWGFCGADDAGWQATMSFAFSPANSGWVPGRLSGLGSAHTRGAWTLGDVQAWIVARALGDAARATAALRRLERVALADGMLPEAYDPEDGAPIRHWFAWPGAAMAALRMLADRPERIASAP